jgi:hypothetical protein
MAEKPPDDGAQLVHDPAPPPARRPKVKPGRSLYFLASALLGAVLLAALLPVFVPQAAPIFEPAFLRIIYGLLSLAIALVTLGSLEIPRLLCAQSATIEEKNGDRQIILDNYHRTSRAG